MHYNNESIIIFMFRRGTEQRRQTHCQRSAQHSITCCVYVCVVPASAIDCERLPLYHLSKRWLCVVLESRLFVNENRKGVLHRWCTISSHALSRLETKCLHFLRPYLTKCNVERKRPWIVPLNFIPDKIRIETKRWEVTQDARSRLETRRYQNWNQTKNNEEN